MKRINRTLCLSIIIILLLGNVAFADMVAIVTKKSAAVRQQPNAKGKVIFTAKQGYRFNVTGQRGNRGWRKVYDSKRKINCWILENDVTIIFVDPVLGVYR